MYTMTQSYIVEQFFRLAYLKEKKKKTRVIKSEDLRVPNQGRNPLSDILERH